MKSTRMIRGFRDKRKLNSINIAELLGISEKSYQSLENDLLNNDCILVFKLLDIFNLSEVEIAEFFDALKQDYSSYDDLKK